MKIVRLLLIINLLAIGGHFRPAVGDEVRPMAFLHALEDQGYGDMAVDYLNMLKRNDDLSKELRDTWDLEMSKSLRSAAQSAYNAEDSESLMREAEKHLTKFLQEKPDHPEASEARAIWADFSMDKALKDLRSARTAAIKNKRPNFSTTPATHWARPGCGSNKPRQSVKPNWMPCSPRPSGR